MRSFLVIFSFLFVYSALAQRSEFLRQVRSELAVVDQLREISGNETGSATVDPVDFPETDFENAILSYLKDNSKNKMFVLQESYHLKKISEITIQTIRSAYFGKKNTTFIKLIRRAQHATLSKFGLIEVHSFEIPLTKVRPDEFYFDKKGAEGTLSLYYNPEKKKKPKKGEEEEEEPPKPIKLLTEQEVFDAIEAEIRKNDIYSGLRNGNYYAAGVTLKVNPKTLFRKKVPAVRVVITLGSKRMQLVQKKVEKMKK